jgi:hypothetical protein
LTSARWAHDLAEVQAVGSATSTVRTAWQTETAVFWQSDTAIAVWNRVADDLADSHETTLTKNARLLALTNIALADAVIANFNAKNTYNFWRPVTAIRDQLRATTTFTAFDDLPVVQPPGTYPGQDNVEGMASMLTVITLLALLSAIVLVSSTMTTLIGEQTGEALPQQG